jgi:hypothetical protein
MKKYEELFRFYLEEPKTTPFSLVIQELEKQLLSKDWLKE